MGTCRRSTRSAPELRLGAWSSRWIKGFFKMYSDRLWLRCGGKHWKVGPVPTPTLRAGASSRLAPGPGEKDEGALPPSPSPGPKKKCRSDDDDDVGSRKGGNPEERVTPADRAKKKRRRGEATTLEGRNQKSNKKEGQKGTTLTSLSSFFLSLLRLRGRRRTATTAKTKESSARLRQKGPSHTCTTVLPQGSWSGRRYTMIYLRQPAY